MKFSLTSVSLLTLTLVQANVLGDTVSKRSKPHIADVRQAAIDSLVALLKERRRLETQLDGDEVEESKDTSELTKPVKLLIEYSYPFKLSDRENEGDNLVGFTVDNEDSESSLASKLHVRNSVLIGLDNRMGIKDKISAMGRLWGDAPLVINDEFVVDREAQLRRLEEVKASSTLQYEYLNELHMEVIDSISPQKDFEYLSAHPFVTNVWYDEILDGSKALRGGHDAPEVDAEAGNDVEESNDLEGMKKKETEPETNPLEYDPAAEYLTIPALYGRSPDTLKEDLEDAPRAVAFNAAYPNGLLDPLYKYQWGHQSIRFDEAYSVLSNPSSFNGYAPSMGLDYGGGSNFGSGSNQPVNTYVDFLNQYRPTNPPTVIAMIDSGIDVGHPDLKQTYWRNWGETDCFDGIDNDGNGYIDDCVGWDWIDNDNIPQDENGHGTSGAGIIAALGANGQGVSGVCPNCRLMVLRTLDKHIRGSISGFIKAINYALQSGVKISNNSYGGRGSSYGSLEAAIIRAERHKMLFIAASGNYGSNNDIPTRDGGHPTYPASYRYGNMISVGACDQLGQMASFSCYGKNTVDLCAPGVSVISTTLNGRYSRVDGTSFATPYVTGVAGTLASSRYWLKDYTNSSLDLPLDVNPLSIKMKDAYNIDIYAVKDAILNSVQVIPSLKSKVATSGTVDLASALKAYIAPYGAMSFGSGEEGDSQNEQPSPIPHSSVNFDQSDSPVGEAGSGEYTNTSGQYSASLVKTSIGSGSRGTDSLVVIKPDMNSRSGEQLSQSLVVGGTGTRKSNSIFNIRSSGSSHVSGGERNRELSRTAKSKYVTQIRQIERADLLSTRVPQTHCNCPRGAECILTPHPQCLCPNNHIYSAESSKCVQIL